MKGLPEFLAEAGWEVFTVASFENQAIKAGLENPKYLHLKMTRSPSPVRDLISLFSWVKLLRKVRPDVVFVGTPKAGMLGTFSARIVGVPVRVYHVRGLRLETSRWPLKPVLVMLEKLTTRFATAVLCVSQSLRIEMIHRKLSPESKTSVIGLGSSNGIDLAEFGNDRFLDEKPPIWKIPAIPDTSNRIRIGYIGRISEDKGIRYLLAAHRILIERGLIHDLVLVGDFEDESSKRLFDETERKTGHAFHHMFTPNPELFFSELDIFCLPTLREGFPNVVLEAGASRLPTVTTDATGAVDSVIDMVTGIIVPKGTVEPLANALAMLANDSLLRKSMGNSAFEFVKVNFQRTEIWNSLDRFLKVDAGYPKSMRGR